MHMTCYQNLSSQASVFIGSPHIDGPVARATTRDLCDVEPSRLVQPCLKAPTEQSFEVEDLRAVERSMLKLTPGIPVSTPKNRYLLTKSRVTFTYK